MKIYKCPNTACTENKNNSDSCYGCGYSEALSANNAKWREKIEEIIKIVETQIGEYIYAPIINKDVPDWVLKLELVLVNLQELLSEMEGK